MVTWWRVDKILGMRLITRRCLNLSSYSDYQWKVKLFTDHFRLMKNLEIDNITITFL